VGWRGKKNIRKHESDHSEIVHPGVHPRKVKSGYQTRGGEQPEQITKAVKKDVTWGNQRISEKKSKKQNVGRPVQKRVKVESKTERDSGEVAEENM